MQSDRRACAIPSWTEGEGERGAGGDSCLGWGGTTGARAGRVAGGRGVTGNGRQCRGSRTWHVEDGVALVHGVHVGARAHVDAGVLGLDLLNRQDAVEVHGAVGQLPVAHAGPDQGVGW